MIVIGADTHKRSHALAAVDAGTGRVRGQREIKADEPGHLAAVRWARDLDEERVWAIEDCRAVSRRFEQALLAAGERVVRVAPHRMGASRRGEREPGKSDEIDALAIARAVVKDGPESFAAAFLDEEAMEIRLLCDHRGDLVQERTRVQNRLRWHLLELCPELERSLGRGAFNQARVLDRVERRLRKLPAGARVRVAREQVAHIRRLNRRIEQLKRELLELVRAHRPQLLAETGCGPLVAAILIGRTAGAERFRTDASFARQTGTAPIPCSSGKRTQHRLNRGGDRQLNHALHIIAVSRARPRPGHEGLPGAQASRGQDQEGSAALPQAPPRPPLPPAPLAARPTPTAARRHDPRRHHHRRRRPNAHALPDLAAGGPQRPCAARRPVATRSRTVPREPGSGPRRLRHARRRQNDAF
jgi:transposase